MRKEVPEIGWGDFEVIPTRDPAVLVMRYDWRNNSVLFVHNLDAKPREDRFLGRPPRREPASLLINLLADDTARPTSAAGIRCCSKATAIAGTASAASTTCSSAAISIQTPRVRRSPVVSRAAEDDPFIRAQLERAFHNLARRSRKVESRISRPGPIEVQAIEAGFAPGSARSPARRLAFATVSRYRHPLQSAGRRPSPVAAISFSAQSAPGRA